MSSYFTITKYSHFFSITNARPDAVGLILKFSVRYVHKTFAREGGKTVFKASSVFGVRVSSDNEFRFHIGQYEPFIKYLEHNGVDSSLYTLKERPIYEPRTITTTVNSKFESRDYQTSIIKFLTDSDLLDNRSRLVGLQTGGGKAQPLTSSIRVAKGWVRLGSIQVGDEVITQDGSVTKVSGVYDQGVQDVYKVTFGDGRSTRCTLDHLWKVSMPDILLHDQVLDTRTLTQTLASGEGVYIPLPKPEHEHTAYIDRSSYIHNLVFDSPGYEHPIHYSAPTSQRLMLLREKLAVIGIDNIYGTIVSFIESVSLAKDIQYLVRSLGGIAYLRMYKNTNLLHIVHVNDRMSTTPKSSQKAHLLRMVSIEPDGKEETRCISIEHSSKLYVTDDFIVTHNTFVSLAASSAIGHRTMIVILPKYIEKWSSDITEILNVDPKDILVVRGSKDLKSMLNISTESDISAKYIIVSLSTLQSYYEGYRVKGREILNEGYPYLPEAMYEHLGIGTVIFDEVHQHLYSVFKVLAHTHVPKVIALSATLISDDPFITEIQSVMFPREIRYNKVPVNKYVKIKTYAYGFNDRNSLNHIRTTARGSTNYSHIELEKSIMRHKGLLRRYGDMIVRLINLEYTRGYIEGDKCLVFAATIAMCTYLTQAIREAFPQKDVRRYVEDDPYENVIDSDIRVSTIISAGTAVDIPNLRVSIMTNNVQSPVANLQALGRLRKLKDRDVTYVQLYCHQIPKHVAYHQRRKELFMERAVSIKEFTLPEGI